MCGLCSSDPDEVLAERKRLRDTAGQLRRFASELDEMANGNIKPHGAEAVALGRRAAMIIRYLAADWL